jgi:hypothetical protein
MLSPRTTGSVRSIDCMRDRLGLGATVTQAGSETAVTALQPEAWLTSRMLPPLIARQLQSLSLSPSYWHCAVRTGIASLRPSAGSRVCAGGYSLAARLDFSWTPWTPFGRPTPDFGLWTPEKKARRGRRQGLLSASTGLKEGG